MATYEINVSCDKQTCGQCGKKGVGFYSALNAPGKYICQSCVLKNIDRRGRDKQDDKEITKAL